MLETHEVVMIPSDYTVTEDDLIFFNSLLINGSRISTPNDSITILNPFDKKFYTKNGILKIKPQQIHFLANYKTDIYANSELKEGDKWINTRDTTLGVRTASAHDVKTINEKNIKHCRKIIASIDKNLWDAIAKIDSNFIPVFVESYNAHCKLICSRCGKNAKEGKELGDHCGTFFDEGKKGLFCSGTIIHSNNKRLITHVQLEYEVEEFNDPTNKYKQLKLKANGTVTIHPVVDREMELTEMLLKYIPFELFDNFLDEMKTGNVKFIMKDGIYNEEKVFTISDMEDCFGEGVKSGMDISDLPTPRHRYRNYMLNKHKIDTK